MEDKHTDWSEDQYNFDTRRLRVTAAEEDDPDYEGEYHAVPPLRTGRLEARDGAQPSAGGRSDAKPEVACLVKGCNADLTTSKAYYRRFRICEAHMKSMSLSIEGRSCRFCQQCGKFHLVEEFDGANRNCRKALMIRFYKRRNMPLGGMQANLDRNEQGGMDDPAERRMEPRKRGRPRAPRPNITEDDTNAAALASSGGGSPPPALAGSNAAARAAAAAGFDTTLQAAYIAVSRGYQGSSGLGVTPATAIGPPGYSQGGVRMAGIQVEPGTYDNDEDEDDDGGGGSDGAPPRQRRSKGASAAGGGGARRASSRDLGLGGAAGGGRGAGQLDLNLLAGGLPPMGDGLGGVGLGAGGFGGLAGGPLEGLAGLPGMHGGGGLGARGGALGAGHLGGLSLGLVGGLGLGDLRGDLGLQLPLQGGGGGGRGAGGGLGHLGALGLRGGGLLDMVQGGGGAGGGLLLDHLGGGGGLLPQAGQAMRLVLQAPLDGRRGGSGNQSGCSSSHSQQEQQQQDAASGLLAPLGRGVGAARGGGSGQQQLGATVGEAAAEALAALAAGGRLDAQVLLAAAAVAAGGGAGSSEQHAALASLLARLPGGAELLCSRLLPRKQQLQDLEGGNNEQSVHLGLDRLLGRDVLGGRAGMLPAGLSLDHEDVGDLGMGRLGSGAGGGAGGPRLPLDAGGAVRPLGGGLGRGRGVGLDMGAVGGAGAAAGGGGGGRPTMAPLGAGLLGAARGRGSNADMDFPLRFDGGLPAVPLGRGLGRLAGAGGGPGAGSLHGDDAGDGSAGGRAELSLADLLGQMSIPQQLELLMGLPQQQMMEVLKQLPHAQQVELLIALQEDRQNRAVAERQQQQQQPRQQSRQTGVGSPQQQVIMLGAQGLRAAAGMAAVAGGGPGPRPLLDLEQEDDAAGRGGLRESPASGVRLNLAPLGGLAGARGVGLQGADPQVAAKALAALQEQADADEEAAVLARLQQGGRKAGGMAQAAAQLLAADAAGAVAGSSKSMEALVGLQLPASGSDRGEANGEEGKPEAPEVTTKASGSPKASGADDVCGPEAAAQRQPAAKQQAEEQQEQQQPKPDDNNAAGQVSDRGVDKDSGKDHVDRPSAVSTPPAGGAAADASVDTSAAKPVEDGAAADAGAAGAAYSCEEALERLSLKLHGVRPEELAPNVAQRMRNWLQSMDAVTLQGTLRSGCVNLVLDISYRQSPATVADTRAALPASGAAGRSSAWSYRLAAAAIASSLGLELTGKQAAAAAASRQRPSGEATEGAQEYGLCLEAAALAAARGIRVQVQVGATVVYPHQEEQPQGAEVHELAPLAVVQGGYAVVVMTGRNLGDPTARLHVRLNGRRLGALVQPQQDLLPAEPAHSASAAASCQHGLGVQEQEQHCDDECALVFLDPPSQAGLAVLEWEAGGGAGLLGDWWPLVVAPDEHVAAEVNSLALLPATASGRGHEWLRQLLVDVGLMLDAAHNAPAGGLRAGLEPGVLERLERRARRVAPFCEARMMWHTAAVARAFLAAAAAETDRADVGFAVVSRSPSRVSSSLSSACGSEFSDSEHEQEDSLDSAADAEGSGASPRPRDCDCKCHSSPCELHLRSASQ
ncbi:hypothetical protein HXX76_007325 [Chlamydomonas incerta]|uniref:SBP-type domain-containing protein n=1 Tax=Chlamydomonas incerta TaxID=51695 RepID=A0A835SXR2_CHLIN|nr:hypothetical protein HXX76_007325 [Chlamydomonas incerta]|eukprot:KAG2435247.1 hypothetical protein HXX76_007325 [Chlamydomonas incerta]